jgi:fumarate hydratase class II
MKPNNGVQGPHRAVEPVMNELFLNLRNQILSTFMGKEGSEFFYSHQGDLRMKVLKPLIQMNKIVDVQITGEKL